MCVFHSYYTTLKRSSYERTTVFLERQNRGEREREKREIVPIKIIFALLKALFRFPGNFLSRCARRMSASSPCCGWSSRVGLVERRRESAQRRRTRKTNAMIPNIDFDFPDDAYVNSKRNENYHRVKGESLKNKTKRGEVSINFPKNILENDKADGSSEEKNIFEGRGVLPEIPFESLPEIGFALGLSVFSGFWALWEAFGKKAVFGNQEEEEEEVLFLEGDEYDDDDESSSDIRRISAKRKRERHVVQGVDVTLFYSKTKSS